MILLALALIVPVAMAIPPLPPEERAQQAHEIVVGTVASVRQEEVKVDGGTDFVVHVVLRAVKVEKALLAGEKPEATVELRFRRTGKRPPGWTGPQGQNGSPAVGQRVRAFLRSDPKGWVLIEPNGWEPADGK
jgi:hypothetical protein